MTRAYYNEIDAYAAQWLRNLISAGHIAPGDVDERSIVDVQPDDLKAYAQCHFFAGIGGWSLALRLAGIPDGRPVWTGSCPCQPFSVAGAQRGSDDERYLWPAFFRLIRERRPASVFGEQVAGTAGLAWLDHVCADLEDAGYAAASADLPACSVGAPHRRQRLFWVADGDRGRLVSRLGIECDAPDSQRWRDGTCGLGNAGHLANPAPRGLGIDGRAPGHAGHPAQRDTNGGCSMGHPDPQRPSGRGYTGSGEGLGEQRAQPAGAGADDRVDDAIGARLEGYGPDQGQGGWFGAAGSVATAGPFDPWRTLEWIACSDGKARPTQPGLFPLAHGIPNRVGRLRAYGNAIVPQVAATFVIACQP